MSLETIKTEILETLSSGEHVILFEKKDKTMRELRGTREVSILPDDKKPVNNNPKVGNSIPVFDLDKGEWRAFSLTNLKSIDGKEYGTTITEAVEADNKPLE